ncbi:21S rRNA pseudouridine(2819) synthase [Nakaseomyces bracarensis]|uniref:21S rRNA pseudouridine(2819) synthase n=1 Tax=Nakaseomyces bracarensis TaxID=273131 RepID=A0ABR4NVE4_9SACH
MINRHVSVLYENIHYLIIHKPPGFLSEPGISSDLRPIVLDDLIKHYKPIKDTEQWRSVHRLDSCVTGGMLVAKTKNAATMFSRNLKLGGNKGFGLIRRYVALTDNAPSVRIPSTGILKSDGMITQYRQVKNNCFIIDLVTGKKHQIRKHLSSLLHSPILYDQKYGSRATLGRDHIALHSAYIETKVGRTVKGHIIPIQPQDQAIWETITTIDGRFLPDIENELVRKPTLVNITNTVV